MERDEVSEAAVPLQTSQGLGADDSLSDEDSPPELRMAGYLMPYLAHLQRKGR